MCDPVDIGLAIAAIAAAGYGAKTQSDAANEAADRQAAAMNATLEQQDQFNRKAEGKALENADQYDMTDRTQRLEETRQKAGDSLVESLVKSRQESASPEQAAGKVSESFTADRATKLADQFQASVDNARLMGRMRGNQDMLGNEAIMNADYASQLNTIGRNANGSYQAAQPGIAVAGKVDANKVMTGAMLQSLGTTYLGNVAGKGLGSAFGGGDITSGQAAANYGTNAGTQQSSMLAAQEAGMGTGGMSNYVRGFMR